MLRGWICGVERLLLGPSVVSKGGKEWQGLRGDQAFSYALPFPALRRLPEGELHNQQLHCISLAMIKRAVLLLH